MRAQLITPKERHVLNESVLWSFVGRESQATTKHSEATAFTAQDQTGGYMLAVCTGDIGAVTTASSGFYTVTFSEAAVAVSGDFIGTPPLQTCPVSPLSSKFEAFRLKWEKETEYVSSLTQIVTNEAYQKIIGMGESAVPLILRQLEREGDNPNHWSWALRSIVGENPIPDEAAGDTLKIAEAWLAWGRSRYEW